MNNEKHIKGNCACGEVEYIITDKPLFTQACHCKNCKKSTGSSFVIHTMIFEKDLIVNGNVSSAELPTGSGKGYRAYFCVICGVYLYCKYEVAKGRVAIRSATLEYPLTPQAHIFVKDKDPWIEINDQAICFDTMYDRSKIWPKESLERLKIEK